MNNELTYWAEALVHYFFDDKTPEQEVFIGLSEYDLKDVVSSNEESYCHFEGKYIDEKRLFEDKGIKTGSFEDYLKKSFYLAIRGERLHISVDQFFNNIKESIQASTDTPLYLPYLSLLTMSILDNEAASYNDYYTPLNKLLQSKVLKEGCTIKTGELRSISSSLDKAWEDLEQWSVKYGKGVFHRKKGGMKYVGPYFRECILTSYQRRAMSRLFLKCDLPIKRNLSDATISACLKRYGKDILSYSELKWGKIINDKDYCNLLVGAFKSEYLKWDGRNKQIRERKKSKYQVSDIGGTRYELFLEMTIDRWSPSVKFGLKFHYDHPTDAEPVTFKHCGCEYEVEITSRGWSYGDAIPLKDDFFKEQQAIKMVSTDGLVSAVFMKSDMYLFKSEYQKYYDCSSPTLGDRYYVLLSDSKRKGGNVEKWLEKNDAEQTIKEGIPTGFSLYYIKEYKDDSLGISQEQPSISIVGGIRMGTSSDGVTLYANTNSIIACVKGMSKSDLKVYALYDNQEAKDLVNDDENTDLWTLKQETNKFYLGKPFVLVAISNGISKKTRRIAYISPTIDIAAIEHEPHGRSALGTHDKNGIINGLRLNARVSDNIKNPILTNLVNNARPQNHYRETNAKRDTLLSILTSKVRVTKEELETIVTDVFANDDYSVNLQELINNYERLV